MRPTEEQFLKLLQAEQGKLLRIAFALTGQESDAWDMVQEATMRAYDRFGQLRGSEDAFGPWIRRILVNACKNLRRAQFRLVATEEPLATAAAAPELGPEVQAEGAVLWDEVMQLPEHHRQVLVLRYLVDLSVDEMARLLWVPPGTVKSRLNRALGALRLRLESEEGERKVGGV
ncbi:MAG: RNA polymerase sigma factor [Mycobacterium leprae]